MRSLFAAVFLLSCSAPSAAPLAASAAATATAVATIATSASAGAVTNVTTAADTLAMTCTGSATPTIAMTEGPYYKANPPQKSSLAADGMAGTRIVLTGYVLTRSCQPVANVKVDVWQANAAGEYDNSGYTLRGYVLTDAQGRYRVETIVPGEYPGRTPHIHVRVADTLTTQVYFPGIAANSNDGIFRQENLLKITQGTPLIGRYDFVLDRA
ncbi:MAG: dioxygenase [Mycobacteriales bacterium]